MKTRPTPTLVSAINDDRGAADVYAGDLTGLGPAAGDETAVYLFQITADSEPGVLAQVANLFNIANVAPRRATLYRDKAEAAAISIEIDLASAAIADMIRRKLEQLTCTLSVNVVVGDSAE